MTKLSAGTFWPAVIVRSGHSVRLSSLMLLLLSGSGAVAAPTGAELLDACQAALEGPRNSVEAHMCYWYVTPCDCDHATEPDLPRVCLPESSTERARAEIVVSGLRNAPALAPQSAVRAASVILAERFPCTD